MQGDFIVRQKWNLYSGWETFGQLKVVRQQANAPQAQVQDLDELAPFRNANVAYPARSFDGNSLKAAMALGALGRFHLFCRLPLEWSPNGTGKATPCARFSRASAFPHRS